MCLSADWTGILVLSNSSYLGCSFFWSSSVWLIGRPPFLGYFGSPSSPCFGCVFGSVFLGLASATILPALVVPVSVGLLPLDFPCGFPFFVLRGSFLLLLLLSSLLLMATKASALCGALPSTPCCGCCSCAPRSCTEVFGVG